jgi:4-hydroxybenzoyl-CoA thioesterase
MKVFCYSTYIGLRHSDAAGVMFFPRYFELAHECWEALLVKLSCPVSEMILQGGTPMPIVNASAKYTKPFWLGEELFLELRVQNFSSKSVELQCFFKDSDGLTRAEVSLTSVAVSRQTSRAINLDAKLALALRDYFSE